MSHGSKHRQPTPGQTDAAPAKSEEVIKQKKLAEQREEAERHKNDGQKHHKGAR